MFKVCEINPTNHLFMYAGTGGATKGALMVIDSDTAIEASEGISTQIVLGVAAETVDAGAMCEIIPVDGVDIEADIYTGSTIDEFENVNCGDLYDIYVSSHVFYIDPNDTTGGFCLVSRYDNANAKAWIRIPKPYLYV